MSHPLSKLRQDYKQGSFDERDAAKNPLVQFKRWFKEVLSIKPLEPNAMVLASVDSKGAPSMRVVLLKALSHRGFAFFTNYQSRKAKQLNTSQKASLLFYWPELERQVRIEGKVIKVSAQESDRYFAMRPRLAQIGAHASAQSSVLKSRLELEKSFAQYEAKFASGQVPRPKHWGGYLLLPTYYEFWQGRSNRLHDRICYRCVKGVWKKQRLAP